MAANAQEGMITHIVNILELILLLMVVSFFLRILAIMMVLFFTLFHPERRGFYMELFNVKKNDL